MFQFFHDGHVFDREFRLVCTLSIYLVIFQHFQYFSFAREKNIVKLNKNGKIFGKFVFGKINFGFLL